MNHSVRHVIGSSSPTFASIRRSAIALLSLLATISLAADGPPRGLAARGPAASSLVGSGPTAATDRLAALDLVVSDSCLAPGEVRILGDAVRGAIRDVLPPDRYVIMTRENIFELLPEGLDLADCVGTCAVETGRRVDADYVVTGNVVRLGGDLRASLTLYDCATANLLIMTDARAASTERLEPRLRAAAADLALVLPGAARDHRKRAREAAARRREAAHAHRRTNTILLGGAAAALAASGYFHLAADSDHDAHLEATDAAAAVATWDDYEADITWRNVSLGVAGALLAWRLVRALAGGPDDGSSGTGAAWRGEDGRHQEIDRAPHLARPAARGPVAALTGPPIGTTHLAAGPVLWSRTLRFSW